MIVESRKPNESFSHYLFSYSIYALGQPLLDIVATVNSEFLQKWSLGANDAIRATEKQDGLEKDLIAHYPVKYIAGGSVLNTVRLIQWLNGYKVIVSIVRPFL